jgi:hypothetical protein
VLGEERQPAWQQHPLVQQTYVRPYPRTSYDRTTSYETYASGSRYGPSLDPTEALELTFNTQPERPSRREQERAAYGAEGYRYAVPIYGEDIHVRNWSINRQYMEVFNAYVWCVLTSSSSSPLCACLLFCPDNAPMVM